MSKLLVVTDLDGDKVAVPLNTIALVVKPGLEGGVVSGARGKIITIAGWSLEVRESVVEIATAANELADPRGH